MAYSEHILVVDDEPEIRDLIERYLTNQGYRVSTAPDGKEMRRIVTGDPVDLVILDLVMPGEDGVRQAGYLRANYSVGIIMLTSKTDLVDRVVGLEMGADDYLPKPFELRELLARVRSVLRRSSGAAAATPAESDIVAFNGWRLEIGSRRLMSPDGLDVALTTAEFSLLAAMVHNPNRVMSRDRLLDIAGNREQEPFDRSIDVLVHRLRRKIEIDPKNPALIKTVRGGGYLFTPDVTKL
ncbi:MAG: response regulator [Alphaproteobacteria bacterium]